MTIINRNYKFPVSSIKSMFKNNLLNFKYYNLENSIWKKKNGRPKNWNNWWFGIR